MAQAAASSEQWQFELTPYLWGSAMEGTVAARRLPPTDVDMSFSDILHDLDFGLMGAFEARKGRWGILTDGIYMKVSSDAKARRTGPGPVGATLTAQADVRLEQTMLAGALGYRVAEGVTAVDLIAGARYSRLEVRADIAASLFARTGSVRRSGDKDWVDPYVGVRVNQRLGERWALTGYLDYGGFGVASDSTWQVAVGAEYAFSKAVGLKFGYRELHVDYDKDGFLYDMKNSGAYVGVGIRF